MKFEGKKEIFVNFEWKSLKSMEQARNLHDCYFYYYSTCRKGQTCVFRHEPAALGHEEACKPFLEGKCKKIL